MRTLRYKTKNRIVALAVICGFLLSLQAHAQLVPSVWQWTEKAMPAVLSVTQDAHEHLGAERLFEFDASHHCLDEGDTQRLCQTACWVGLLAANATLNLIGFAPMPMRYAHQQWFPPYFKINHPPD